MFGGRVVAENESTNDNGGIMQKSILISCAIALLLFSHVRSEAIEGPSDIGEQIIVEDALGRKVKVGLPIRSLVALNSDVLEVMRSLKAQDLVSGVFSEITKYPLFWPKLKYKPKVGCWRNANAELIAQLNPDIVIAYGKNPGQELEKKLSPFGITVLRLDFYKVGTLEKEIAILGRLIRKEKEAEKLCAWYRKNLNTIHKRLKSIRHRPEVYIESYTKHRTSGPGTGAHEMCVMAGGHNIASDFAIPYAEITPEWVLSKDPEIILKGAAWSTGYAACDSKVLNLIRDNIVARPAWSHVQAVKQGRVYVMDSGIWTGPRAIIGIFYLAKLFHPNVFEDLHPEAIHREYFEIFQGVKFKGVYVSQDAKAYGS